MQLAASAVKFHFTQHSDPFSDDLSVDRSSSTASASGTQAASTSQVTVLTDDMQKLAIATPTSTGALSKDAAIQSSSASLADESEGLAIDTPPFDAIPQEQMRHYNMRKFKDCTFDNSQDIYDLIKLAEYSLGRVQRFDDNLAQRALRKLERMKHFNLPWLHEPSISEKTISFLKKYCKRLESLNASGQRFQDSAIDILKTMQGFTQLNFSGCLQTVFNVAIHQFKLEVLNISNTPLSEAGVRCINVLTTLRNLYMSDCGAQVNYIAVDRFKDLDVLVASNNPINDDFLVRLTHCRDLSELDVSDCSDFSAKGLDAIFSLKGLKKLRIGGPKDHQVNPERLQVQALSLNNSPIGDRQVVEYDKAKSLTNLSLMSCDNVSIDSVQLLLSRSASIRKIDVRGCAKLEALPDQLFLLKERHQEKEIRTFLDDPAHFNPAIHRKLDLRGQNRTVSYLLRKFPDFRQLEQNLPPELFRLLIGAIPSITVLDLHGIPLGAESLEFLKGFTNLESLSLENCKMSKELLEAFRKAFPKLQQLNVKGLVQ